MKETLKYFTNTDNIKYGVKVEKSLSIEPFVHESDNIIIFKFNYPFS